MPGMRSGLNISNPMVAEAFRAALRNQLFVIAGIFLLLWLARLIAASWWPASAQPSRAQSSPAGKTWPEPVARRVLRIGFGLIWIFDGILQAQPTMPLGLASHVIEPSAASSPGWVRHFVNWAARAWTYHPIPVSAAAVWIQVGLGLWLLVGGQGLWSRFGALASTGWGLIVWMAGESFGGIFAPGLTWLFGAPGAALFYCAAGLPLALPLRAWRTPRLGRLILTGLGVFFAGMAVLQAWPGRGFWQGTVHGHPGTLTGMVQGMSQTPQPHFLARLVADFGGFVAAHGFAVNLFTVIALAAIGATFVSAGPGWGQPLLARVGVWAAIVLCLADWVLIEDFGFFGGLGTDPNSMIPMALLFVGGYLAMTRVPAPACADAVWPAEVAAGPERDRPDPEPAGPRPSGHGRLATLLLSALRPVATASAGSVAALGALGVTLVGALPAVAASANPHADPIIAQAIGGTADPVNYPAKGFTLTGQDGAQVSLHGKVVLLTFLDPVRTSGCPLIGREFAAPAQMLAAGSSRTQVAAIVLSPVIGRSGHVRIQYGSSG
jgi:hypothetical protein